MGLHTSYLIQSCFNVPQEGQEACSLELSTLTFTALASMSLLRMRSLRLQIQDSALRHSPLEHSSLLAMTLMIPTLMTWSWMMNRKRHSFNLAFTIHQSCIHHLHHLPFTQMLQDPLAAFTIHHSPFTLGHSH